MPELSIVLPIQDLQILFDRLVLQAQQPLHADYIRLSVAGQKCGWVLPNVAQVLRKLPSIEYRENEIEIGYGCLPGEELDSALEIIANVLRVAGYAPAWRNELLDVWGEPGRYPALIAEPLREGVPTRIGAIERGATRALGLVTRAVHLNAWSENGGLWVARRALTKPTNPGMWDTLVGGLVGSGEDDALALERETGEEAGLDAHAIQHRTPLRNIMRMHMQVPTGLQIEDVLTCECTLPEDIIPVNQDGEVMDIQCLNPKVIVNMLQQGAFTAEASIVIVEDLLRRVQKK